MKVVIVEDEQLVVDDLSELLCEIDMSIEITHIVRSVKEGISVMKNYHDAELIFSDIQLGDGYSFEIFEKAKVAAPVIYCTAYNEFALNAFEANGIGYVLKPYTRTSILNALERFKKLRSASIPAMGIRHHEVLKEIKSRQHSILVNSSNRIIPVRINEIAYCSVEGKESTLITLSGQKHSINKSLEELECLCGDNFFRVNRQQLVNRNAIAEVMHYGFRKLFVVLYLKEQEEIIIGKHRASEFLEWLKGGDN